MTRHQCVLDCSTVQEIHGKMAQFAAMAHWVKVRYVVSVHWARTARCAESRSASGAKARRATVLTANPIQV